MTKPPPKEDKFKDSPYNKSVEPTRPPKETEKPTSKPASRQASPPKAAEVLEKTLTNITEEEEGEDRGTVVFKPPLARQAAFDS